MKCSFDARVDELVVNVQPPTAVRGVYMLCRRIKLYAVFVFASAVFYLLHSMGMFLVYNQQNQNNNK